MQAIASEKERQVVMNSDAKILDNSTQEGGFMVFPAHLMPDGEEFRGQLPESGLDKDVLASWVANVRGQYNAREKRKDAEASERGAVLRDAEESGATLTDERGRRISSEEKVVPPSKEALDTYLKSQISDIDGSLSYLGEQHTELANELGKIAREISKLHKEQDILLDMLQHYEEVTDDTSDVCRETGEENH